MELLSPLSENPDGLSLFGVFCLSGFLGGLVCCCWVFLLVFRFFVVCFGEVFCEFWRFLVSLVGWDFLFFIF